MEFYHGIQTNNDRETISKVAKDPRHRKVIRGGDIDRFEISYAGDYVLLEPASLKSGYKQEKYLVPQKLLMRTTGDTPIVAYDDKQYFCINSINLLLPTSSEPSLPFVLGILNSKLLAFYYRALVQEEGKTFAEVKIVYIEQLPMRRISFTTPATRRKALAEQGRKLYEADLKGLIQFVEKRLAAHPEESDVVHDLLAYLSEQMIDLNRRKQAEQKRLLGWLESKLKINPDSKGNTGIDALTGKSKLHKYLGDYQKDEPELSLEELEGILNKNRSKLGVNLSDERFRASLRAEYDKSLTILRPIKDRLASTDRLIDQIVYKLYGLTDEEVAIVEAGTKAKSTEED